MTLLYFQKIKPKRPWRNKVRKLAMKAAKRAAVTTCQPPINGLSESVDGDGALKRKKKKKKIITSPDDNIVESSSQSADIDRLDSARFRYINERLYMSTGADALRMFTDDPEAYQCYHRGYVSQVYGICKYIQITLFRQRNGHVIR